jgi:hypothetical protein
MAEYNVRDTVAEENRRTEYYTGVHGDIKNEILFKVHQN